MRRKKKQIDVVVVVDDPALFTGYEARYLERDSPSGVDDARRSQKELETERKRGSEEEEEEEEAVGGRGWPSTSIFKTILTRRRDKGAAGWFAHSFDHFGGGLVHQRRNK